MRFETANVRLAGVLARSLRKPKVRTDLKVSEQIIAGELSYLIMLAEGFFRISPYEYQLLQLCDGTRTPADMAAALAELYPDQPVSEPAVADWLDSVHPNLWERSLGEKNLAILQKIRDERKQRVDRSNIFYIKFSAWNPGRALNFLYPSLRWMFTRAFVLFCLGLFALTALVVLADYERIRQDTIAFYTFTNKTLYDIWIFWFLLFVVSGVHEFGHGLTCKHFGGDVPAMGFLLMYFTPAFYTDVSEMYMFDKGYKRLWTIFAGLWIELVFCCLATFVWYFSPPGSFLGDLGYKTLLLTGVSGVLLNLNPLMKLDGYYALSQYLEIENLYEDSFAYLKAWVLRNPFATALLGVLALLLVELLPHRYGLGRYFLTAAVIFLLAQTSVVDWLPQRRDVELPPVSRKRARIYFFYGVGAFTYSVMILLVITLFANNVFTSKWGNWGYLFTAAVVYLLMKKRVRAWLPALRAGRQSAKERFMVWRLTRKQQIGGAVVAALLLLPLPPGLNPPAVSSEFILEPGARAPVRAVVPGLVQEVRVREGDAVGLGQVLALLHNPEIEARAAMAERDLQLAERSLLAARARNHLGEIQKYTQERQRLDTELTDLERKLAALTLRAPLRGVVTTPRLEQLLGEYLDEGEEFALLADRRTVRARILVRDWELEEVSSDARAKLNLRAYPGRSFSGRVRQIMPAAAPDRPVADPQKLERRGQELTNYFAVVLELENPEGLVQEGMTGTAKIYGRGYPLAWRAVRGGWRWLRSHVW